MNLKGAVAVLSGAGRTNGVGAATAELLAQKGCNIVINCLKNESQAQLVVEKCRSYNVTATLFMGDVTKASTCHEMATMVQNEFGRTDILVNSLGFTKAAAYEKLTSLNEDDFAKMFSVNVTAPYLMCQAFQEMLRGSDNGVVINISSVAGMTGKGSSIAYAAAKGGENALTLALAQALSPEVRVNAICPSFIDSSWWEEQFHGNQDKYKQLVKSMSDNNLLGRVLRPIDVAQMIFAIIMNPVMSGELIRLDAGAHIGKANTREVKQSTDTMVTR